MPRFNMKVHLDKKIQYFIQSSDKIFYVHSLITKGDTSFQFKSNNLYKNYSSKYNHQSLLDFYAKVLIFRDKNSEI